MWRRVYTPFLNSVMHMCIYIWQCIRKWWDCYTCDLSIGPLGRVLQRKHYVGHMWPHVFPIKRKVEVDEGLPPITFYSAGYKDVRIYHDICLLLVYCISTIMLYVVRIHIYHKSASCSGCTSKWCRTGYLFCNPARFPQSPSHNMKPMHQPVVNPQISSCYVE